MVVYKNELKMGKITFLVWSGVIAFMLAATIFVYPSMAEDMETVGDMMANMGSFSEAFGMDRLNFGTFIGHFGVESGNILGIGGLLFSSLLGISILAKEEKEHTAEFLFTHPYSRTKVLTEKLFAVFTQIVVMNLFLLLVAFAGMYAIDETADIKVICLIVLAFFLMQIEMAAITFGISAFLSRGGVAIGLGLAAIMYFVNLFSNIMDEVKFLKYFTPLGYTDAADIISKEALNMKYLGVGMVITVLFIALAYYQYSRKDLS